MLGYAGQGLPLMAPCRIACVYKSLAVPTLSHFLAECVDHLIHIGQTPASTSRRFILGCQTLKLRSQAYHFTGQALCLFARPCGQVHCWDVPLLGRRVGMVKQGARGPARSCPVWLDPLTGLGRVHLA